MVTENTRKIVVVSGFALALCISPVAAYAGEGPDQDGNDGGGNSAEGSAAGFSGGGSSDRSDGDAALDRALIGTGAGFGARCCGITGAVVGGVVGGYVGDHIDLPSGDGSSASGGLDAGNPNAPANSGPPSTGGGLPSSNLSM
jgi:hypothetical protein